MADPVATVETIVKIAVAISKAVDKAQRNIDDCKDIQTLVATASGAVKVLKEKGVMDKVPELRDALGHLKKTLKDALKVVKACQKDQNFVQRVFMAENLSNLLAQVKVDITQKTTMANFAINAYMAANANHACHHLKHDQNRKIKVSTDKKVKTPINKKVKTPNDKKAKMTPTDKNVKTPTNKKAKTPTDKKDKTPSEHRKTPTDQKAKTPTHQKAKTPTDKKAKTPTDHKAKMSTHQKAKTPADKKAKMPTD